MRPSNTQIVFDFLPDSSKEKKKTTKKTHIELNSQWGTFKDSLRSPIHNWFQYPAGFSYKAVEFGLASNKISKGKVIYDPFMGCGTTNVVAKAMACNSYGCEAHPFVFLIAKVKLNWELDLRQISKELKQIQSFVQHQKKPDNLENFLHANFPELVTKCYVNNNLYDLFLIREAIADRHFNQDCFDFYQAALACILREVSSVATGWPYIAPNKKKSGEIKDVFSIFTKQILKMVDDIEFYRKSSKYSINPSTFHKIYNEDSRNTQKNLADNCVDFVFTSPPYLNNYDYADRTRLEMYFFGHAANWKDISDKVRTRLMTSATTQISRADARYNLSDNLKKSCPDIHAFLEQCIESLGKLRLKKGGKKSYDLLVSGYFNDMYQVLQDVYRVLKPATKAMFVLGDSAPYGVYIPTDEVIGKIAKGIGFTDYTINILRTRGEKWKDNPQRHDVLLRESIVTLQK